MTKQKMIVIWVGVLLIVIMAIIPPWVQGCNYKNPKLTVKWVIPKGYYFIFTPPTTQHTQPPQPPQPKTYEEMIEFKARELKRELQGLNTADVGNSNTRSFDNFTYWHIDWGRLFLQWSIVILVTVALLYPFRKEKVDAK